MSDRKEEIKSAAYESEHDRYYGNALDERLDAFAAGVEWCDRNPAPIATVGDEEAARAYAIEQFKPDLGSEAAHQSYMGPFLAGVRFKESQMRELIETAVKAEQLKLATHLNVCAEHWLKISRHPAWGGPITEEHMNPNEYVSIVLGNISKVFLELEGRDIFNPVADDSGVE